MKEQYCIEADDRVCHQEVLFIGSKQECLVMLPEGRYFPHRKFGGITAHIVKYDGRCKDMRHDIHENKY